MRKLSALLLAVVILGAVLFPAPNTDAQSSDRYFTALSGEPRTSDTNSSDFINIQQNLNVSGVLITLDITEVADTPRITPSVQFKDPASGKYESLLTASSGVTGVGTHSYLIYPGAGTASGDITQVAAFPLPHVWRVSVAHMDTDAITYTVGASLLP